MKMSVFVNENFLNAFGDLMGQDLPIKTAYSLKKIQKKLQEENERFDELRKELVTKHATKNENGEPEVDEVGNVKLEKEVIEEFNKGYNELLDIDFESDSVSLDDLGDIKLSAAKLVMLDDLIKE